MYSVSPYAAPMVSPIVSPYTGNSDQQLRSTLDPGQKKLPRFANYLADLSGCGHWRVIWPEQVINATNRGISHSNTAMVFDPRWYAGLECIKIQRQASSSQVKFVQFLKKIQQEHGFKIIYEVDDVVFREEIPDYNKFKFAFDTDEIRQNCVDIINMVDEVTVTCDFMRTLYREKTGQQNITVIPNFVPDFWMGHLYNPRQITKAFEDNKKKPRILYTGSGAHYDVENKTGGKDDLHDVRDFIRKTVDKYQWIFVGAFPPQLTDLVQQKKIEFHPWQNLLTYPRFISNLNAQLMVAPLQVNNFNNAKSDIKFIEACVLGIPCLCQNMETYSSAPDALKFSNAEEFESKIDMVLNWKNRSNYYKNMHVLRAIGEKRLLEIDTNISAHVEVLTTKYGSERKYLSQWN